MRYMRQHIADGLLSGFPICCIVWFVLRHPLFQKKWFRRLEEKYWSWGNKNVSHIQCPYHRFFEKKPTYYICTPCDWYQRDFQKCLVCNKPNLEKKKIKI
jgi:hypothetical protein